MDTSIASSSLDFFVCRCHIIHLSNIVDAKRKPSRVYYSNMTTPSQEMQEMWNNL